MTHIGGVIFDKDGTLFDFSMTWEAWAVSFLHRIAQDETQAAELGRAVGFNLEKRRFERDSIAIAGTPEEVSKALIRQLPTVNEAELIRIINDEASRAPQMEVVPLQGFVRGLKDAGLRVGVVTNDAEAPARAHLKAAQVDALFDFIAGSDSGWGAKPEPGQLLACAHAFQKEPGEVVMVGDSTHDLIAAQRAGMRAVAVLTGMADTSVLAPYAETVLPDIGHLPAWLEADKSGQLR